MDILLKAIAPKTIIMAMAGVFVLTTAALLSYGLLPLVSEYRLSLHTLKMLEDAVTNADSLNKEIENIENETSMLEKNMHGEMENLPDKEIEAYIIGRLQEVSWGHRVKLLGVRPGMVNTMAGLVEIPFDVEVSGDYFDIYGWIQNLDAELRFMAITHFVISPQNSGGVTQELKASITVVAYREAASG